MVIFHSGRQAKEKIKQENAYIKANLRKICAAAPPPRFRYLVLVADPLPGSESVQLAGSADLPKQS